MGAIFKENTVIEETNCKYISGYIKMYLKLHVHQMARLEIVHIAYIQGTKMLACIKKKGFSSKIRKVFNIYIIYNYIYSHLNNATCFRK